MNNDRKEELLTRWMDDALSGEELRELKPVLDEQPELHEERQEYAQLREDLRASLPSEVEPPYPDFFNSHLERLVREASRSANEGEGAGRSRQSGGAFNRIWLWWMAPAATAAVVAAFLLGMNSAQPENPGGVVDSAAGSEAYSPLANVSTQVFLDKASDSTLIVVEGLDPLTDTDLAIGGGFIDGEHGFFVNTGKIY